MSFSVALLTGTTGTEIAVEQNGAAHHTGESAYRIVNTTGARSATWTRSQASQAAWSAALAAFKQVTGGAPNPTRPRRLGMMTGCGH